MVVRRSRVRFPSAALLKKWGTLNRRVPRFLCVYNFVDCVALFVRYPMEKAGYTIVLLLWDDRRKTRKYSLGMRQRLGIACTIMEEPRLLILDELFNGLDAEGYELVRKIILEERCNGTLVILACHNREELESLSDVIYLIWSCSIS